MSFEYAVFAEYTQLSKLLPIKPSPAIIKGGSLLFSISPSNTAPLDLSSNVPASGCLTCCSNVYYVYVYVYVYVCVYICVYVYVCVCVYGHGYGCAYFYVYVARSCL